MPLEPGKKLGPYEIVSTLGAGGMGEVYRARDTRLERTVAVKVLPSHLSGNAELRERFDREAKSVSRLNHPHICTLHDVGHEDGIDFLVMELLEGDNLAEKLKAGPLAFDQSMKLGGQIADALAAAHAHGVIHRDLKPANVMLTKDGAKLLDFGLAKQHESGATAEASALSSLPTEAKALTGKGELLGTFQYMAPEQLEGEPVTPATDIFALGALLYEMITGRRAFDGGTPASLISVIMTSEPPPPSSLGAMSPPALDALIRACLAKDPTQRWQSAADVSRQLQWIAEGGGDATVALGPAERGRRGLGSLVAGVALGALVMGLLSWTLRSPPIEAPPSKLTVSLPPSEPLRGSVALSPDGRTLVYIGLRDGEQLLFRRALDEWEPRPMRGTEDGFDASVSPDGEWVAFVASGDLKKTSLSGGEPVTLCHACAETGGTHWGRHGRVVFAGANGLYAVPDSGGDPQMVWDRVDLGLSRPALEPFWLPGGDALLFSWSGGIQLLDLESRSHRQLFEGRRPVYTSTGHLVFSRGRTLWAVAFDADQGEVRGEPVPVLENVFVTGQGLPWFTVSQLGTLAYVAGSGVDGTTLVKVNREGEAQPLFDDADAYLFPRLSPDGSKLAVSVNSVEDRNVWVLDVERGTRAKIVPDGTSFFPAWAPDGERVSFLRPNPGGGTLVARRVDGMGGLEVLVDIDGSVSNSAWHPAGEILAFNVVRNSVYDIGLRAKDGAITYFTENQAYDEMSPAFSPDGRYVAYVSSETGELQVYVQSFPGPGGKFPISRSGGREPVWSRDGRSLFYRNGGEMWEVAVETGADFRAGAAKLLFEEPYRARSGPRATVANYDVFPDGEHFVMVQSTEEAALTEVRIILDWDDELKRLAPVP